MSIEAINNISTIHSSRKNSINQRTKVNDSDCEQVTFVVSKDTAKAMRNLVTGLMILGASVGAGAGLASCDETDSIGQDEEYVITNTGDTIPIPRAMANEGYYNYINKNY